jgi:hypothetical protein
MLFTWCDIYPDQDIPINIFNQNLIFTFGNECRYIANENNLQKHQHGNVIGIFYFHNYQGLQNCDDTCDLCDVYCDNYRTFNTYNLNKLIDIGDIEKLNNYYQYHSSKYNTRFFNKIIDNDNSLTKLSICEQGNYIIQNEIYWYKNVDNGYIPHIFSYGENEFTMEKINAKPLYYSFWDFTYEKQCLILENTCNMIKKLHETKIYITTECLLSDIEIEIKHKILHRLEKVQNIIESFGEVHFVNGIEINKNHEDIINDICASISSYFMGQNVYSIIHGDSQFSNILYDYDDKLYLIDPRGYFGNTKLYGICEYDYAKIGYSLSGYDNFNNDNKYFIEKYEDYKLELRIEDHIHQFENILKKYGNMKILKQLIVINWLGLSQYNQNNILKCVSSYYYALYLYKVYKV